MVVLWIIRVDHMLLTTIAIRHRRTSKKGKK